MKKWSWFKIMVTCILILTFCGCAKSGGLFDGIYVPEEVNGNTFVLYEGETNWRQFYCLEIKGEDAMLWISGSINYKAKIRKREEKIYFEGYTWKEPFAMSDSGINKNYEIEYDASSGKILLRDTLEESCTIIM